MTDEWLEPSSPLSASQAAAAVRARLPRALRHMRIPSSLVREMQAEAAEAESRARFAPTSFAELLEQRIRAKATGAATATADNPASAAAPAAVAAPSPSARAAAARMARARRRRQALGIRVGHESDEGEESEDELFAHAAADADASLMPHSPLLAASSLASAPPPPQAATPAEPATVPGASRPTSPLLRARGARGALTGTLQPRPPSASAPRPATARPLSAARSAVVAAPNSPLIPPAKPESALTRFSLGILLDVADRNAEDDALKAEAAAAAAGLSGADSKPKRPPALVGHTQAELEAQVADDWTSSDDDDLHLTDEFKSGFRLSRTQRRALGLRSMREVMRALARPLARREEPLLEYAQHGSFPAVSFWPAEGRFAQLQLQGQPAPNSNPRIADPLDPVQPASVASMPALPASLVGVIETEAKEERVKEERVLKEKPTRAHRTPRAAKPGSVAHLRAQSLAREFGPEALAALAEASAVAASESQAETPRKQPTTEPGALSPRLAEVFSLLDPSGLHQSESEIAASYAKQSARVRQNEAAALFAAAQAAPFVQLRGEGSAQLDQRRQKLGAFEKLMSADHPLLSDAQIDALLAAKIDESVRKGYPRNRAELAGLSRTGAVSFGIPSAHPRSTEAQVEHDVKLAGGRANTLQNMFFARADQSGSRAAKAAARKGLVALARPYSAVSSSSRARAVDAQVERATAKLKHVLDEAPPVGFYNPDSASFAAVSADLASAARDAPLPPTLGLGAAEHLSPTHKSKRERPASAIVMSSRDNKSPGPGPADIVRPRLFDERQPGAGVSFPRADVGMRTALMGASGLGVSAHTSTGVTSSGVFSALQLRPRDFAPPPPFVPLRMQPLRSTIGTQPQHAKISFARASTAREADSSSGVDSALHGALTDRVSRAERVLQYASSSTIGPRAPRHARSGPAISIPRATRDGVESQSHRQVEAQRLRRAKQRAQELAARKAADNARKAEQDSKREARRERLARAAAIRDRQFFKAHMEVRLGADGARQAVLEARAAAARQAEEALQEQNLRALSRRASTVATEATSLASSSRARSVTVSRRGSISASTAAAAHVANALLSSDSESDLTDTAETASEVYARSVRDRLGPLSQQRREAKLARMRARSAVRDQRLRSAREHRAMMDAQRLARRERLYQQVTRRGEEATARMEARTASKERARARANQTQPLDATNDADTLREVQMIWSTLLANASRLALWARVLAAARAAARATSPRSTPRSPPTPTASISRARSGSFGRAGSRPTSAAGRPSSALRSRPNSAARHGVANLHVDFDVATTADAPIPEHGSDSDSQDDDLRRYADDGSMHPLQPPNEDDDDAAFELPHVPRLRESDADVRAESFAEFDKDGW